MVCARAEGVSVPDNERNGRKAGVVVMCVRGEGNKMCMRAKEQGVGMERNG